MYVADPSPRGHHVRDVVVTIDLERPEVESITIVDLACTGPNQILKSRSALGFDLMPSRRARTDSIVIVDGRPYLQGHVIERLTLSIVFDIRGYKPVA